MQVNDPAHCTISLSPDMQNLLRPYITFVKNCKHSSKQVNDIKVIKL